MSQHVDIAKIGPLPAIATVRVSSGAGNFLPGRTMEAGDAVHGRGVYVRAFGSWRPGVIHFTTGARTRVPVAFRTASTPTGQYCVRNFTRTDIRIPTR